MADSTPRRHRPDVSSLARWMPFELLVALRFLREGRMQSALILAGVTGGVAVIIFLTQLINQLQATIVDRVMGSQAHVVIRPLEEATQRVLAATPDQAVAAVVQPRAQRLRSVDQWEQIATLAAATPGVVAVSPVVSGPAFASRGGTSKSVVVMGVQPQDYGRVVKMDGYMTQGRFDVTGTRALIGIDLAQDLGLAVGDKLRVTSATGRAETLDIGGLFGRAATLASSVSSRVNLKRETTTIWSAWRRMPAVNAPNGPALRAMAAARLSSRRLPELSTISVSSTRPS